MKGHFINGRWIPGQGKTFTSQNPCDETQIWEGQCALPQDVAYAFEAAQHALPAWRGLSLEARFHFIQEFINRLEQNQSTLIHHLSLETGKPFWEAKQELNAVLEKPKHALDAYQKRMQENALSLDDHALHLRFKPIGVVAVLGAFNFPIHLSHGHIIPALLAGNTAIYKPSELTPAINELIMQCWQDSGLPDGVLNMIQGGAETAQFLIQCPIDAVYFTGSYQTGQAIHASLHSRPEVLLALEMGGNNPLIVGEVSNLEAAVYQTIISSFITAGQRCSCARRLMVPNTPIGEEFLIKLRDTTEKLIIGAPKDTPAPFMGPVIRRHHALLHLEKQSELLRGAEAWLPMRLLSKKGGFLSAGIVIHSSELTLRPHSLSSSLHLHGDNHTDQEIFAPLLQVYQYDTFEEALQLANHTTYGLTAGLFSDDPQQYAYFYKHIHAGVLTWNRPTTGASSRLPFGGVGKSGNHRPCGYFSSDYTTYPVASAEQTQLQLPAHPLPGILS